MITSLLKLYNRSSLYVIAGLVIGVVMYYGFNFTYSILYSIASFLGENLITSSSDEIIILQTSFVNLIYIILCGIIVSAILSSVVQLIFKPQTMFLSLIAIVPFVIMSYWWFFSDIKMYWETLDSDHLWALLLSPLVVIIIWLLFAKWFVMKNAPNKSFNQDAQ